jgi:hypothetical protein
MAARVILRDNTAGAHFVARLAALGAAAARTVYAYALLPNGAHLLFRTGTRPLPRVMRSLLAGDAGAFNRRLERVEPLFQKDWLVVRGNVSNAHRGLGTRPKSTVFSGARSPAAEADLRNGELLSARWACSLV